VLTRVIGFYTGEKGKVRPITSRRGRFRVRFTQHPSPPSSGIEVNTSTLDSDEVRGVLVDLLKETKSVYPDLSIPSITVYEDHIYRWDALTERDAIRLDSNYLRELSEHPPGVRDDMLSYTLAHELGHLLIMKKTPYKRAKEYYAFLFQKSLGLDMPKPGSGASSEHIRDWYKAEGKSEEEAKREFREYLGAAI
jgi:SNF2 family DNA or RNA helicase